MQEKGATVKVKAAHRAEQITSKGAKKTTSTTSKTKPKGDSKPMGDPKPGTSKEAQ